MWLKAGRTAEARALVAPLLGQFSEGFATADLRAAKHIVDGES